MTSLITGAVGRDMDIAVSAEGTNIILTLDLANALIHQAEVTHAIAVMREWRPPQTLADVVG